MEAYAATNKTFVRAIEYFVLTLDGNNHRNYRKGVSPEDISHAVLRVFPGAAAILDRPINFYGEVLDESNQPVSGANVDFEWKGFLIRGTRVADVLSGQGGLFSLTNKTGTERTFRLANLIITYHAETEASVYFDTLLPSGMCLSLIQIALFFIISTKKVSGLIP